MDLWLSVPPVPNGTLFTNTVEMTTPTDDVNPPITAACSSSARPRPERRKVADRRHAQAGPIAHLHPAPAKSLPGMGDARASLGHRHVAHWARVRHLDAAAMRGGTYFPTRPDYPTAQRLAWNNGTVRQLPVERHHRDRARDRHGQRRRLCSPTPPPSPATPRQKNVEPFYNDNTSVVTATIVQYKIYLPVIKNNESSSAKITDRQGEAIHAGWPRSFMWHFY